MKKALSDKIFQAEEFPRYPNVILVDDVKQVLKNVKNKLWSHQKKFEGEKGKTCLPIDIVEQILKEEVGEELIE